MKFSDDSTLIIGALAEVNGKLPVIPHDTTNSYHHSTFTSLRAIVEVTKPILKESGLLVIQSVDGVREESGLTTETLTTRLIHIGSGEWCESQMLLHLRQEDPQSQGSAITYARRYQLGTMLGIVTEKDDDGNASMPTIEASTNGQQSFTKPPPSNGKISEKQIHFARSLVSQLGWSKATTVSKLASVISRDVKNIEDLTSAEAITYIDMLKAAKAEIEESEDNEPL